MTLTRPDVQRLSKTIIGAIIGALTALSWIVFDTGAVILLIALTVIGAVIGTIIDQPERLIAILERLQND